MEWSTDEENARMLLDIPSQMIHLIIDQLENSERECRNMPAVLIHNAFDGMANQ